MKNDRFEKVYTQGTLNVTEIWVDREGKPVVTLGTIDRYSY